MSEIRINNIKIKNYRSFWNEEQIINFPNKDYKKPVAIVWYNNAGKSNLMNAILYCMQVNFVSRDTFSVNDFHNKDINNVPQILLNVISTSERKYDWKEARMDGYHKLNIQIDWNEIEGSKIQSLNSLQKISYRGEEKDDENYQAFGAGKYFNIFYINFHNIKDEIQTWKTSWWNIRSFLWKHIKKIIDSDAEMQEYRVVYNEMLKSATNFIVEGSKLDNFINQIKKNYTNNLRRNSCKIEFWLPDYEDIFLQMVFKIWLKEDENSLVPLDQFGDGFISMFVMSVIQTISETNDTDKCLFLFEEPESFLHENHQEYFYKTVLCWLAEKWHQVIYTTHSDKMIDIFDTKWLIRLENDDSAWTVVKYNDTTEFSPILDIPADSDEEIIIQWTNEVYNQYIKNIEPNLNKILFSKKVILVEWPNDLMCYAYAIKMRIEELEATNDEIVDKKKYADTFLNFKNIVIIPHHWKATALLLIQLCKHIKVDYFVINDFDFEPSELNIGILSWINTIEELKGNIIYTGSDKKWMITVNFNLIQAATPEKIHFNIPKLERVIGYGSENKNAVKIWKQINSLPSFNEAFFPKKLEDFLLNKKAEERPIIQNTDKISIEDTPF